jgi:CRP-like cAMP-binding protein
MTDINYRTPLPDLGLDGTNTVTYLPGDVIRAADTSADWIGQVREGRVTLRAVAADGSERLFSQRRAGAWLGLEALAGRTTPYALLAHTAVVIVRAPTQAFQAALTSGGTVARALLDASLDETYTVATEQVLLRAPAEERIRNLFSGAAMAPSWGEPDALTRQDLARLLNMRPETLSRLSTRLRPRNRRRAKPAPVAEG